MGDDGEALQAGAHVDVVAADAFPQKHLLLHALHDREECQRVRVPLDQARELLRDLFGESLDAHRICRLGRDFARELARGHDEFKLFKNGSVKDGPTPHRGLRAAILHAHLVERCC